MVIPVSADTQEISSGLLHRYDEQQDHLPGPGRVVAGFVWTYVNIYDIYNIKLFPFVFRQTSFHRDYLSGMDRKKVMSEVPGVPVICLLLAEV